MAGWIFFFSLVHCLDTFYDICNYNPEQSLDWGVNSYDVPGQTPSSLAVLSGKAGALLLPRFRHGRCVGNGEPGAGAGQDARAGAVLFQLMGLGTSVVGQEFLPLGSYRGTALPALLRLSQAGAEPIAHAAFMSVALQHRGFACCSPRWSDTAGRTPTLRGRGCVRPGRGAEGALVSCCCSSDEDFPLP